MGTKIIELKENVEIYKSKLPLVIGYFGSIHVMHRQLFDKNHRFNVLTFKDFKKKADTQLYSFKERIENIKKFNPSNIYVYDINTNNMKAEEFIQNFLIPLNPASIVVGTDFKFGSDNKPYKILKKYFNVETVAHNDSVSTTKISKLLQEGKIGTANSYLCQPYYYVGKWIGGNKKGRQLGYKTINVLIDRRPLLPEGSYATQITLGIKKYNSVSFVGKSKTFNIPINLIETFIIDKRILPRALHSNKVKNNVKIEFYKFIRENTKFDSLQDLIKAISKDVRVAKSYFSKFK